MRSMISQNCGRRELLEARNLTGKKDVSKKEVMQQKQKLSGRNDSKRLTISDLKTAYNRSPLTVEDTFQEPQWMPKAMGTTKPCIYYVFSYTY